MKKLNVFVTVGTQLPYPRLLEYMFSISDGNKLITLKVQACSESYQGREIYKKIDPKEYNKLVSWCDLMVAHAGMGSILTAMEFNKPIIIVPRLSALNEHRNDHQIHTAEKVVKIDGIYLATKKNEIEKFIINYQNLRCPRQQEMSGELLFLKRYINNFIDNWV